MWNCNRPSQTFSGNFGVSWFSFKSQICLSAIIFYGLSNHCVSHNQSISMYLRRWVEAQIKSCCVAQNHNGSLIQPSWQRKNLFPQGRNFKFCFKAFIPNGVKISLWAPGLCHIKVLQIAKKINNQQVHFLKYI